MAKAGGLRPRALGGIFGGYFLVAILVAYFLAGPISPYDAPGYIRWIGAAYVLLGAAALVGVCVGALRRATTLDARLFQLEAEERALLDAARKAAAQGTASPRAAAEPVSAAEQADAEVEQLLMDLHRIGESVAAEPAPDEEPAAEPEQGIRATADLRVATGELERLGKIRKTVGAFAAGPAIASAGVLGLFAALL
ncbi:MAG TPA: hypothetical protein VEY12_11785, partial [Thermoplasmata archaeon]|nr:hypothetical protein [Thermoplasmata archaeon]